MSRALHGLFAPVTTPFDGDGRVVPERFTAQLEIYRESGLAGAVLFGTSGEGPLLEESEEAVLLAAAVAARRPGFALVAQVGRESAPAAAHAAARASAAGVDALLCLPPRYYPAGDDALADYYRTVAAAGGLSLLAYHIPQRTHVTLGAELLAGLAAEGVLAGIKDSAGDLALQAELRRAAGPRFVILNGRAMATAAALEAGANGAILAVADAAPEVVRAVFEAHVAGDAAARDRAQSRLEPLAEACGTRYGVPGIKAALDARGWPGGGPPRAPLRELDEAERREVADALQAAGVALNLTPR